MHELVVTNMLSSRETEAKVRAEYESRLQHETEERARLAEEVEVRKAAEERLHKDRIEMDRERDQEKKMLQESQKRTGGTHKKKEKERQTNLVGSARYTIMVIIIFHANRNENDPSRLKDSLFSKTVVTLQ